MFMKCNFLSIVNPRYLTESTVGIIIDLFVLVINIFFFEKRTQYWIFLLILTTFFLNQIVSFIISLSSSLKLVLCFLYFVAKIAKPPACSKYVDELGIC